MIAGDAVTEIRKLKEKDGNNMVLWGSISLAQSLIKENLIDEFHIQICPTIVGGGRPLFPEIQEYKNLKLIEFRRYDTGLVYLHYEPC